jgi:predicted choloylglycine hydrolase
VTELPESGWPYRQFPVEPVGDLEYHLTFHGVNEPVPGHRWRARYDATWPGYRRWYLGRDEQARPDLATAAGMLARYMPELMPTYQRLVELAGGDETTARMLTLWNPPRFAPGCSQLVLTRPRPVLCRNYDYAPELFEGVVYTSRLTGRRVLGTSDCLWGLLDGMNDAGLVVSLAFGGQPGSGPGFGIPLVVRYLLEVADTTPQAVELLRALPVAMAYNLTLVDADAVVRTAYLAPGQLAEFSRTPAATNHRGEVPSFPEAARALRSVERRAELLRLAGGPRDQDVLGAAFLSPPLYNTGFSRSFGTLYTALYDPAGGYVDYRWPGKVWRRTFDDPDATTSVTLREGERQRVR